MKLVYAMEDAPESFKKSVFLAGPTPRDKGIESWRPSVIKELKEQGYNGVVFIPESKNGEWKQAYDDQIEWEEEAMNKSDCILFWVPRNLDTMPAFTTNVEFGEQFKTGKVVLGFPKNADKMRYLEARAKEEGVPVTNTIKSTVKACLSLIGDGSRRVGGEREIPSYIWVTDHFQSWMKAQKSAGNRLDGAKLLWIFRINNTIAFSWAIHVKVWIASEKRHKENEFIISRPDISTILGYYRPENASINDIKIVTVKEFRSPANNKECFIHELAGGSSFKGKETMLKLASDEFKEETGLKIKSDRFKYIDEKQLVSTFSTHKAHLFAVELDEDEIAWLENQKGVSRGVEEDTEKTYTEVKTLGQILDSDNIDWNNMGQILFGLHKEIENNTKKAFSLGKIKVKG